MTGASPSLTVTVIVAVSTLKAGGVESLRDRDERVIGALTVLNVAGVGVALIPLPLRRVHQVLQQGMETGLIFSVKRTPMSSQ